MGFAVPFLGVPFSLVFCYFKSNTSVMSFFMEDKKRFLHASGLDTKRKDFFSYNVLNVTLVIEKQRREQFFSKKIFMLCQSIRRCFLIDRNRSSGTRRDSGGRVERDRVLHLQQPRQTVKTHDELSLVLFRQHRNVGGTRVVDDEEGETGPGVRKEGKGVRDDERPGANRVPRDGPVEVLGTEEE